MSGIYKESYISVVKFISYKQCCPIDYPCRSMWLRLATQKLLRVYGATCQENGFLLLGAGGVQQIGAGSTASIAVLGPLE